VTSCKENSISSAVKNGVHVLYGFFHLGKSLMRNLFNFDAEDDDEVVIDVGVAT
jgi:hypothetical protein